MPTPVLAEAAKVPEAALRRRSRRHPKSSRQSEQPSVQRQLAPAGHGERRVILDTGGICFTHATHTAQRMHSVSIARIQREANAQWQRRWLRGIRLSGSLPLAGLVLTFPLALIMRWEAALIHDSNADAASCVKAMWLTQCWRRMPRAPWGVG